MTIRTTKGPWRGSVARVAGAGVPFGTALALGAGVDFVPAAGFATEVDFFAGAGLAVAVVLGVTGGGGGGGVALSAGVTPQICPEARSSAEARMGSVVVLMRPRVVMQPGPSLPFGSPPPVHQDA
jgi:hypothetical protein